MDIVALILTVLGLILFEVVSSIDNAIINAEVLSTMQEKSRRWFLFWGILFGVFLVRGLLPWLIVWAAVPDLGFAGSFMAAFSSDPSVHDAVDHAKPVLLMGGGIFLVLLFLHWLFLEEKNYGLPTEKFFAKHGVWFYTIAAVTLAVIVYFAIQSSALLGFAAVVGSTVFFITHGFKQNAEQAENNLKKSAMSDISKILYLEIIDMTFSIDGVLGAFAFTMSVPIILIGNGIGAVVVRQLTIGNIERIKAYRYLKNGAMYSILGLGGCMVAEGFGVHLPSVIVPVVTFAIIGFFLIKSIMANRRDAREAKK